MKQEYESLDRKIFEETVGITKITSVKKGEAKKFNTKVLTDSFIDGMSDEMRDKLLKRLLNNIEIQEQKRCECSLSKDQKL